MISFGTGTTQGRLLCKKKPAYRAYVGNNLVYQLPGVFCLYNTYPDRELTIGSAITQVCTGMSINDGAIIQPATSYYFSESNVYINWYLTGNTIPDYAFNLDDTEHVQMYDVRLPSNITHIGKYAFKNAMVEFINLKDTAIRSIDEGAFWGLIEMYDLVLPRTLKYLSPDAFEGSYDSPWNNRVTCYAQTPPSGGTQSIPILGYEFNGPIYVPAESVELYKHAAGWSYYADNISAIST